MMLRLFTFVRFLNMLLANNIMLHTVCVCMLVKFILQLLIDIFAFAGKHVWFIAFVKHVFDWIVSFSFSCCQLVLHMLFIDCMQ